MCDKLQLGCVVVGGGTGGAVLGKRFLTSQPCRPGCRACDHREPGLVETG